MIRHWPMDGSANSLPSNGRAATRSRTGVDGGSRCLHEVERERVAGALIGVQDSQAWVKSDRCERDRAFVGSAATRGDPVSGDI